MNSFDHKVVDGFIQTMERNGAGLARFGEVKGKAALRCLLPNFLPCP
jgi:hypothetical protein